MEQQAHSIWYVRKGTQVTGPFTAGLIGQFILLERIGLDDELSADKLHWSSVQSHPELIPEVMQADLSDPYNQERLAAARRWADERGDTPAMPPSHLDERRQSADFPHHHHVGATVVHEPPRRRILPLTVLAVVVLFIIVVAIRYTPGDEGLVIDCSASAHAGVVWDNCHLPGVFLAEADLQQAHIQNADLSGADLRGAQMGASTLKYTNLSEARLEDANLRGASLVGTNFTDADLRGANLEQADLAYAKLLGARLEGVSLQGARLDNAIWFDGRLCGPGSIGRCLTP